jgi:hypothetical protein
VLLCTKNYQLRNAFKIWLGISAAAVYLLGALRTEGVDIANYKYSYEVSYEGGVPDVGFRFLMDIFIAASLPWKAVQFFSGIVGLIAVRRGADYFGVSKSLLLLFFLLHLIVVRDFAQLRVGLAVSFLVIGLTLPLGWRIMFYVIGASIHITTIPFIIAYEACIRTANIQSKYTRRIVVLLGMGLVCVACLSLSSFAFLDPRIELYMSWKNEGYGMPVNSYGLLILHGLMIFGIWKIRAMWAVNVQIRALFYLEIVGVTTFLALSNHAIFAFRISNVILSLYPVLFLLAIDCLRVQIGTRSATEFARATLVMVFCFALLLRPESYEIIVRIFL